MLFTAQGKACVIAQGNACDRGGGPARLAIRQGG